MTPLDCGIMIIPKVIVKAHPHINSDKELDDPDANPTIRANLWITKSIDHRTETGIKAYHLANCLIDEDNHTIIHDGKPIDAVNVRQVIELVAKSVSDELSVSDGKEAEE